MSEPSPPPGRVRAALNATAGVAWRVLVIAAVLWLIGKILGLLWVIVLPLVLALFFTSLLWPAARFLRKHKWPPTLAALAVVLGFFAIIIGALAVVIVPVASQAQEVTDGVTGGLQSVQDWLSGPPLNLGDDQIGAALDEGLNKLQEKAGDIIGIVLGGISTIGNALFTLILILTLVFFYLKDGPRFLPWLNDQTSRRAAPHVAELATRYYGSLANYMRAVILVGLIDGVFIGVGLLIVGVPLVLPLAVLTFIGAFIPIVGAFVAGAVAVLVALVSNGFTAALIVLGIIIVVQQIEGNVLAPLLTGKSLQLHGAIVILAITAGGSLAGITGAFLAVPGAAIIAITWRYVREQLERAGPGSTTTIGGSGTRASAAGGAAAGKATAPGKAATESGRAAVRRPGRRPK